MNKIVFVVACAALLQIGEYEFFFYRKRLVSPIRPDGCSCVRNGFILAAFLEPSGWFIFGELLGEYFRQF